MAAQALRQGRPVLAQPRALYRLAARPGVLITPIRGGGTMIRVMLEGQHVTFDRPHTDKAQHQTVTTRRNARCLVTRFCSSLLPTSSSVGARPTTFMSSHAKEGGSYGCGCPIARYSDSHPYHGEAAPRPVLWRTG